MKPAASKQRAPGNQRRRKARRAAMQATYQWLLTGDDPDEIAAQFLDDERRNDFDDIYFKELFVGATVAESEIFSAVKDWLDRPVAQLDPVEKAILQIACFEMKNRADIPYRVVINEAVELSKRFGAEESFKYINAVMDKAASAWRSAEVGDRVAR